MVKTTYEIEECDHSEIKLLAKKSQRADVAIVRQIIKNFLKKPRKQQCLELGIMPTVKSRTSTG